MRGAALTGALLFLRWPIRSSPSSHRDWSGWYSGSLLAVAQVRRHVRAIGDLGECDFALLACWRLRGEAHPHLRQIAQAEISHQMPELPIGRVMECKDRRLAHDAQGDVGALQWHGIAVVGDAA